jgi:hypothetical protein
MSQQASLTDRAYLALTTAMRTHLPREVRNIIYGYVLDGDTMAEVHAVAFGTPPTPIKQDPDTIPWSRLRKPATGNIPSKSSLVFSAVSSWTSFLRPGVIDEEIRLEIIRIFCDLSTLFAVEEPRDLLLLLLCKPLFKSGLQVK